MATKNLASSKDIYQLKVSLLGTKPPVWRRVLVPADLTFAKLHDVLQTAMGWYDEHMHEFRISQRRMEVTATLSAVLRKTGARMNYTYDFGDNWEHLILLERRLEADPHTTYPMCTDGKLACPPEDCGGVHGYYDLLKARADRRHPRHQELREWVGDKFDPESFSPDEVNRLFASNATHSSRSN